MNLLIISCTKELLIFFEIDRNNGDIVRIEKCQRFYVIRLLIAYLDTFHAGRMVF